MGLWVSIEAAAQDGDTQLEGLEEHLTQIPLPLSSVKRIYQQF